MPEISFGTWSLLPVSDAAVLALSFVWGQRKVLIIHNLAPDQKKVSFPLEQGQGKISLADRLGEGETAIGKDGVVTLSIEGYGCRWIRVED